MNTSTVTQSNNSHLEAVREKNSLRPWVDVYENNNEFLFLVDLPGVAKENLSLHFEKRQLTIEAHRKEETPDRKTNVDIDYFRAFAIPYDIDVDKIDAQFNSGILRVVLPKSEALIPRKIEVRAV